MLLALGTCAAAAAGQERPPQRRLAARIVPFGEEDLPVQWKLHLDTETVSVLHGGLRRGTLSDTVAMASVAVNTGRLGLWRGGRVAASFVGISSGQPSLHDVGDIQVMSNIAAPSAARMYELWVRQRLGGPGTELRAGVIDLNAHFAVVETAAVLLNASFGITPSISLNAPAPIFPKPGLGVMVSGGAAGWRGRVGVFQSNPAQRSTALDGGGMGIAEVALGGGALPALKVGGWTWRRQGDGPGPGSSGGTYAVVQSLLGRLGPGRLSGFAELGSTPGRESVSPRFVGIGAALDGPLRGRPRDRLEAGIARAWIQGPGLGPETAWELTYLVHLAGGIHVQPDLQVITRPGGGSTPSAVVGTVRLHVELR